ncbi:MAG: hypothetical protein K2W96_04735 [Gemmataceae bacterium]|nr:hypothetical protein [Gemmataceae bacterium]
MPLLTCPDCGKRHDAPTSRRVTCPCGRSFLPPPPPPGGRPDEEPRPSAMPLLMACGAGLLLVGGVAALAWSMSSRPAAPEPEKPAPVEVVRSGDKPEPPAEKPPVEKPPAEKPPVEKPPTEKPPVSSGEPGFVGAMLYVGGRPDKIDLPTVAPLPAELETEAPRTWEGHKDGIRALAFSHCGKYVVSGSGVMNTGSDRKDFDNTIRLWDARTGKELKRSKNFADSLSSLAFSPGGRYALISTGGRYVDGVWRNGRDHTVYLWDVQEQKEASAGEAATKFVGLKEDVVCVAFSPKGDLVAAGGNGGGILVWDAKTGRAETRAQGAHAWPPRHRSRPGGPLAGLRAGRALAALGQLRLARPALAAGWRRAATAGRPHRHRLDPGRAPGRQPPPGSLG